MRAKVPLKTIDAAPNDRIANVTEASDEVRVLVDATAVRGEELDNWSSRLSFQAAAIKPGLVSARVDPNTVPDDVYVALGSQEKTVALLKYPNVGAQDKEALLGYFENADKKSLHSFGKELLRAAQAQDKARTKMEAAKDHYDELSDPSPFAEAVADKVPEAVEDLGKRFGVLPGIVIGSVLGAVVYVAMRRLVGVEVTPAELQTTLDLIGVLSGGAVGGVAGGFTGHYLGGMSGSFAGKLLRWPVGLIASTAQAIRIFVRGIPREIAKSNFAKRDRSLTLSAQSGLERARAFHSQLAPRLAK